jgi:VWFA-related protein
MIRDFDEDSAPLARAAKALLTSGTAPDTFSPEDKVLFKSLSDAMSPMQQPNNQARVNITYPAFRAIGRHLGGMPGRKNLVWIAAVFPLTFCNSAERRKNDQEEVDTFRNNLTEANITLYTVDPGGTGASFNTSDGGAMANEGSLMPGALRNAAGTSSINNSVCSFTGNQSFQIFSDATGGKSYRNANDIEPALREVIALSGYSYTLGFYPDEKTLDNKSHELKVTLVKKPATDKAKTAHRKQYFAWGPKSPADTQMKPGMEEVLGDPLLARSIGLMAVANPDPSKPGALGVDLRIAAADLRFEPKGDQFGATFDVAFALEGAKVLSMKTYSPSLPQDALKQVMAQGMDTREVLDPGVASGALRIVVLDRHGGPVGVTGAVRQRCKATRRRSSQSENDHLRFGFGRSIVLFQPVFEFGVAPLDGFTLRDHAEIFLPRDLHEQDPLRRTLL